MPMLLHTVCMPMLSSPSAEHYADELELELAEGLLEDFHLEAEDGSPAQACIWISLCQLHASA